MCPAVVRRVFTTEPPRRPCKYVLKDKKVHMVQTSLVVQWLGICAPTPGTWVLSLVRKLGYHIPYGAVKKKEENQWNKSLPPFFYPSQSAFHLSQVSFMYHYSFLLNVLVFDPFGIF